MSRLTADAWEPGDMLGLAWNVYKAGTPAQLPDSAKGTTILANHMFVKPEQGAFTTKGNVFKGWHFAYWPFSYMENPGTKVVAVNPDQTEAWTEKAGDRFDNAFYLSAQHFLTKEDLDENYQLTENKTFDLVRAVNEFVVVAQPSTAFAENTLLNNLKIKSVQLVTDKEVFSSFGKIQLAKLPVARDEKGINMYKEETAYNEEATKSALVKVLAGASANRAILPLKKNNKHEVTETIGFDNNLYTIVEEANLVTGQTNFMRLFTLPAGAKNELTLKKTKIVIVVENGTFTIDYTMNAAEGSDEAYNNAAIEAIVAAYSADGYTRPSDKEVVKMYELSNLPIGLNVRLLENDFKPVFTGITNYEEWKKAVDLVDALGFTTVQPFGITGDIEVDEATIKMPANCGIKVSGNKNIILKKSVSQWPENLNVEKIKVQVDNKANLTIADGSKFNVKELEILEGGKLTMKAGKADALNVLEEEITNNGTIIVNKFAHLKGVTNNTRVEIKYGGVVETVVEGTIFYTVAENDNVVRYNNLMKEGNVNTFVVKSGMTFDYATNSSNVTSDEYGDGIGSTQPIDATELANIKFELNGGNIIGKQDATVKAIEVLGGENTISDVVVTDAIDIVKGSLAIDGTDVEMAADVNVAAGAELVSNVNVHVDVLTNNGTVTGNADKFHCNNIVNNGTLTNVNVCDCVANQEDRDEMQQLVEAIQAKDSNVVNEETLAQYINNYITDEATYNANPDWLVSKLLTLMKDYEISFTFSSVTANDIKLFEVAIGVDIEF